MAPSETTQRDDRLANSAEGAPRPLHEVVADRIRVDILGGELYPGTRLVEDRLARKYDVSRHPIREALRTLQLEGLVDISPRRGATVTQVSAEEAGELFEVLAALDGLTARLAADNGSAAVTDGIRSILDDAAAILGPRTAQLAPEDQDRLAALNRQFHTALTKASSNRQLIDTITPLRDRIQWIQADVARGRSELSWAEHEAIFNAICDGDAVRAESLAKSHIDAAKALVLSHWKDSGE